MTTPKTGPAPAAEPVSMYRGGNLMPVPDPTVLTTQAIAREINSLKELFETRLSALDRATELLQTSANHGPAIGVIEERVTALLRLIEEKFKSVASEFSLRDIRSEQASRDTKTAVDAALQAAEKAVNKQNESAALAIAKSETSTIKSIDQIAVLLQSVAKANDDKVSDLKDRIGLAEGRSGSQAPMIVSILSVALSVSAIIVVVIMMINRRG